MFRVQVDFSADDKDKAYNPLSPPLEHLIYFPTPPLFGQQTHAMLSS
jgi:hypothetical protein